MKTFKTLFWITLIGGIIVFGIGLYLKFSRIISIEMSFSRYSPPQEVYMIGFTGIYVGTGLLIFAVINYRMYREKKRRLDKME